MSEGMMGKNSRSHIIRMAGDVVTAYVSNNQIQPGKLPDLINSVFDTLSRVSGSYSDEMASLAHAEAARPAVSLKRSVTPDYLICLEDGKKLKVLKRHLRTTYNMTPEEYRAKWSLPPDYPMVAPNYAAHLSRFAKKIGLGRKGADKMSVREDTATQAEL